MPSALLYQDHISLTSPVTEKTARVERFQTDSYSVRAARGINAQEERVNVEWFGLSASQARALNNQLDAAAISLLLYTPPPFTSEKGYTCESFSITPIFADDNSSAYAASAVLRREYDYYS